MTEEKTDKENIVSKAKSWVKTWRSDSWQNWLTGLGTVFDKSRWSLPRSIAFLDAETLENLFVNDPWAKRIVEDPVHAALRQGFDIVSNGTWVKGSDRSNSYWWYEPDPEEAKPWMH
jgi:hypothetical protein